MRTRLLLLSLKSGEADIYVGSYASCIRPFLAYATEVWSPPTEKDILRIERIQRFLNRVIFKHYHMQPTPYMERFRYLNLDNLEFRCIWTDLCITYKTVKGSLLLMVIFFLTLNFLIKPSN